MADRRSSDDWSSELFIDDEPAVEPVAPGPARRPGPRRGVPPQLRALRLGAAVATLIAAAVLVATMAAGSGAAGADRAYVTRLAQPASDSQLVGAAFERLMTQKLPSSAYLQTNLEQLLRREQQVLTEAATISPSPTLRPEYQQVIDALQLRDSGLAGLLRGFQSAKNADSSGNLASVLSAEAARLLTSDVIWSDEVVTPTKAQLAADGATGVSAPQSTFLSNAALATSAAMSTVLTELSPPRTTSPPASTQLLKLGDTGPAVSAWQRALNAWIAHQPGSAPLTVSGTFDQATLNATLAFQTAAQITADGVVGPATRSALTAASASSG